MNLFTLCRHNNSPDVPARLRESQQSNIANKENDSRSHQALDHRYIEELVAEGKTSYLFQFISAPDKSEIFKAKRIYCYDIIYLLMYWKDATIFVNSIMMINFTVFT